MLTVPFDGEMDEALTRVAAECVTACPTAALSFAQRRRPPVLVELDIPSETKPEQTSGSS